jgi:Holliday junction resolvase RusA-like endonuclease
VIITLRCVPPSVTAQQKRVRIVRRRGRMVPQFFHGLRMQREGVTWAALLAPHVPAEPLDGPLALSIRLVYPHLQATPKRDVGRLLPKISKPDAGNAAKHLEDLLTRMRFLVDDARIVQLTVSKWHGPAADVGIRIELEPLGV